MSAPLRFALAPSRRLGWMLAGAHLAAAAVLFALPLPAWANAGLILLLAFSLFHYVRRYARLSAPDAIVAVSLAADGATLFRRDGGQVSGRLSGDSVATPYLSVLNVRPQGARFAQGIVVLPDSLDAESFRRLRVWLRWGVQRGA